MQNARKIAGWAAGIASGFVLSTGAEAFLRALHIPTYLPIPFLDSEGDLRDGFTTDVGIVVHILSIMLAVRIGEAVYTGRITARYDRGGNVDFVVWFGCIFAYGVGSAILYNLSVASSLLQISISLALIGALYFLGKNVRRHLMITPVASPKPKGYWFGDDPDGLDAIGEMLRSRARKREQQAQASESWKAAPDYEGLGQYAQPQVQDWDKQINHPDSIDPLKWNPAEGKEDYEGLGQYAEAVGRATAKKIRK